MPLPYPAYDACYCHRCAPSEAPAVCSRCGEEIRIGWRDGHRDWWHRGPVDHVAIQGHLITAEALAQAEAQMDLLRTRESADGKVVQYTARTVSLKGDALEKAKEDSEDEWDPDELPEPEVRSTLIDVGDERLPGGAKQILNLARKTGWEATATYARGPLAHGTTGKLLRVVDSVVVRARLDEQGLLAVASWRTSAKGKPEFRGAWIGRLEQKTYKIRPANSDQLKAWLKQEETP